MTDAINEMASTAASQQFDQLLTLATAFSRRYPQHPYGPVCLSVALAGKGRYEEAIPAVSRAVQLGLDPVEAAMFRASTYQQKGDTAQLLKEYTVLTQNGETRHQGYMGRAEALMQIGDFEQALADANQAISISPDEFGYSLRGDIYRAAGQFQKAVDDYSRADRVYPNWA